MDPKQATLPTVPSSTVAAAKDAVSKVVTKTVAPKATPKATPKAAPKKVTIVEKKSVLDKINGFLTGSQFSSVYNMILFAFFIWSYIKKTESLATAKVHSTASYVMRFVYGLFAVTSLVLLISNLVIVLSKKPAPVVKTDKFADVEGEGTEGFGDEELEGFADEEVEGFADEEVEGFADEEVEGFGDEELEGFADEEVEGFADEEVEGFADEDMPEGFADEEIEGFADEDMPEGFGDEEIEGYAQV